MAQAGNDCVLLEYEGAEHGFHYAGYFDGVMDATGMRHAARLTTRCRQGQAPHVPAHRSANKIAITAQARGRSGRRT
jgi:hypothetical protein